MNQTGFQSCHSESKVLKVKSMIITRLIPPKNITPCLVNNFILRGCQSSIFCANIKFITVTEKKKYVVAKSPLRLILQKKKKDRWAWDIKDVPRAWDIMCRAHLNNSFYTSAALGLLSRFCIKALWKQGWKAKGSCSQRRKLSQGSRTVHDWTSIRNNLSRTPRLPHLVWVSKATYRDRLLNPLLSSVFILLCQDLRFLLPFYFSEC